MRSKAVLLMGPTGTGKTDLALRLVKRFPMEIISVDSALVYRGMDIGTAKPSPEVLAEVPHHLVDIRDPAERYSAGAFRRDALVAMADIDARGKIPLLVGGTLLYFRALSRGLAEMPEPDPAIRQSLDAQAQRLGWAALHARLLEVDPQAAGRIHPNDAQRIQRALEVFEQTGKPLSLLQSQAGEGSGSGRSYFRIGLVPGDRLELNKIIEKRFNIMIKKGLLDEVSELFHRGDLVASLPALRAVGYRQLWQYLAGECALEEACRRAVVATRRLAKRQMTWLRGEALDAEIEPFRAGSDRQAIDLLASALRL